MHLQFKCASCGKNHENEKKYTKYSKRDGKYTKFQIFASSTVARLYKKIRSKNSKKKYILPRA
jgi:uncharacterized protein with NRDE domain